MKNLMKSVIVIVLAVLMALPALALEPLGQNKTVVSKLTAARIADRIRRECDSIDARLIYAYSEARALKREAEKLGYSATQIDDFLDDKAEKARIYAAAEDYLKSKGAKPGDKASFCTVGRAEIDAKSYVGSFLRAK